MRRQVYVFYDQERPRKLQGESTEFATNDTPAGKIVATHVVL